jgi:hypothetical protein
MNSGDEAWHLICYYGIFWLVGWLGEFSPLERLFTWGNFFTITEVADIFRLLVSMGKVPHKV